MSNESADYRRGYDAACTALLDAGRHERAAHAVWRAWVDGMDTQGRAVAEVRQAWETLPDEDKSLDAFIAAEVADHLVGRARYEARERNLPQRDR